MNVSKTVHSILGILAVWLISQATAAASLTASVDRNRISVQETLTLRLEYTDRADNNALDLQSLQQDFDILSVHPYSNSSTSIINGRLSQEATTTWVITLAPRRTGRLVIPSFNLGAEVSTAITIQVTDAASARPEDQPMIVTLMPSVREAYPQQQVLLKVELRAHSRVGQLSGAELTLDDAEIELVEQHTYRRVENGIAWQVVEWTYALFADQPGTLNIPPQMFSGQLASPNIRRSLDPFDPFGRRGQRISARSEAISIEILKPPETTGSDWFPADDVQITSNWPGDTGDIRVGKPLTRVIEIRASGQRASAITPLPEQSSLSFKTYRDQPQLENQTGQDGITGIRRESLALVPSAAGTLELPEQSLVWWNTREDRWEETILAAEILEVLPAIENSGLAPADLVPFPAPEAGAVQAGRSPHLPWQIATALLALICLIQVVLLLRRPASPSTQEPTENTSETKCWNTLTRALRSRDFATMRSALLAWARCALPDQPAVTLDSLATLATAEVQSNELAGLLRELDARLYEASPTPAEDDLGGRLAAGLNELRRRLRAHPSTGGGLAPLYPV